MTATVTIPAADDVEAIDARGGEEEIPCCAKFHPYHPNETLATHVEIVGMAIWNGVKAEKKRKNSLRNARPRRGGRWVQTFKIYEPERSPRCECPACAWSLGYGHALLALHATEVPETAALRTWSAPQVTEMTEDLAFQLDFGFRAGVMVADDFVRMYSWKRHLPGWCDRDEPIAAAFQAASWILRCDRMRDEGWKVDSLDVLRAFHPNRRLLQRKAPSGLRIITAGDLWSAYRVCTHTTMTSLGAIRDKARWKDDIFVADRTILRLMLDDGRSARDIADELGMSASMVARRYKAAIEAIAKTLGPVAWPAQGLGSHLGKFAPGVGRREKRTDQPQWCLRARPPFPRIDYERRGVPISVAVPFIKVMPADVHWLIAEALEFFGNCTVPPGCAAGVHERYRFRDVPVRTDPGDPASPMTARCSALLTGGRYTVLYPRAADWRAIANGLPDDLKKAAMKREDAIADVLGDRQWPFPYRPPTKPESRFAVRFFNGGVTVSPDVIDDDDYCGPVVWRGDKLVPRPPQADPDDPDDPVIVRTDVVDKFDAALGADEFVISPAP